jgi:hypothetical protein
LVAKQELVRTSRVSVRIFVSGSELVYFEVQVWLKRDFQQAQEFDSRRVQSEIKLPG